MFIPTIHGFSTLDITLMVIIFFLVYTLVLKFYKSKQVVVVKDEGKLLYNPNGSDEGSNLIGGDTTNIVNLADIKKPIYLKLFKVAFSNNWIPEKVSNMSMDKYDYEHKLSKELKTIYDTYLSLLIFLDSIQTNNLPNIGKHITLPVALLMLTRQTFDECLIEGHEVLTPDGWKDISVLSEDEIICTYDPETRTKRFQKITKYHSYNYTGTLHHFKGRYVDQVVTDNHRMPYIDRHNEIQIKHAKDMPVGKQGVRFITEGRIDYADPDNSLNPYERFLIALQADGTIIRENGEKYKYRNGGNTGFIICTFAFAKLRKINRLTQILNEASLKFSVKNEQKGKLKIVVYVPKDNVITKNLKDWIKIKDIDFLKANEIINEVLHWDGYVKVMPRYVTKTYFTTNKDNNEILETVASLAGYRTLTKIHEDNRKDSYLPVYKLYLTEGNPARGTVNKMETQTKDTPIYCVSVPDTLFIVRRNNKISVTGNCLHSYSYGYTLTNMMTIEEAEKIVYMWRDNESLSSRNEYITMLYENNKDSNSNRAFLILLIANYILEGVYFYNVFMFFHNLSFMGMMHASNVQIKYIKRDELVHCMFFKEMILQFREENPEDWDEQLVKDMFTEAVKREREFSIETNGDDVLGITPETITDYTYCLGNERLDDINVEQIFPKRKNPYKHLDKLAAIGDETTNKVNSFESTSMAYKQPEIFKGFEKFELLKNKWNKIREEEKRKESLQ